MTDSVTQEIERKKKELLSTKWSEINGFLVFDAANITRRIVGAYR